MRTLILTLALLTSGCYMLDGEKPSKVIEQNSKIIEQKSDDIIKRAEDNKKSVFEINKQTKDPKITEQTKKININSEVQIKDAHDIDSANKGTQEQLPAVKEDEHKADKYDSKIDNKLLEFAGTLAGVGILCVILYLALPKKEAIFLWCGGGAFTLSIGALVLREYWDQFMLGATIAIGLGLFIAGIKIYRIIKDGHVRGEILEEVVNLNDNIIKPNLPGEIREKIFGSGNNPIGDAYHYLSDKADEVIASIRGKDVKTESNSRR